MRWSVQITRMTGPVQSRLSPKVAGLLFLTIAIGSVAARADQTAAAPEVLSALLTEVRGLRSAMEQMASAGPRVQLALGRVQLQEQRIGDQIRRLDSVRANIRNLPNSEGRHSDEYYLAEVKAELARMRPEVQRLTDEESLLIQNIAAEQNRWIDFNQRLEELERALGRR